MKPSLASARLRVLPAGPLLALALLLMAGCKEAPYEGQEAKNYGAFRLNNESGEYTVLYLDDQPKLTVPPGQKQSVRAPDGPVNVSVRTEKGKILWQQVADIPDNAYAQYNVKPDLKVVTSAGNLVNPYAVGSDSRQVRLTNGAAFPVEVRINGAVAGTVAPSGQATFPLPAGGITLLFRKQGGSTLFTQDLDIPRNGYIAYSVLGDGSVVATGGEITPNQQEKPRPPLY